jgi:hypothetical protein
MRKVLENVFREDQNTHFMFNYIFFENCAVYEEICKKSIRAGQATVDNMRLRISH